MSDEEVNITREVDAAFAEDILAAKARARGHRIANQNSTLTQQARAGGFLRAEG